MPVYQDKDKNDKPIKTKDGRSWYFKTYKKDFNKKNKQYESKKYFTKKEAQKAERLFIMKRDNPARKPFSLVAKDYFDTISKVRKQSTCYTYKKDYDKHIKPFFEKYNDINEITVQIIEDWGIELEKSKISVKYMNKIRSLLLNIFNHAMKMPNGRCFWYFSRKTRQNCRGWG